MQYRSKFPIAAIEGIINFDGRVPLLLRNEEPAKGLLWLPGGRQYKGETVDEAILETVLQEMSLRCEIIRYLGHEDNIFHNVNMSELEDGILHYSVHFYLLRPLAGPESITLDARSESYKLIERIDPELHSFVISKLEKSGIFQPNR